MKGLIIAGTQSGVGKTTVTVGLIGVLRERGVSVAPFKAGPDYIDPTYHAAAAGVPSRNLDTWMMPVAAVRRSLSRAASRADLAVIEGVMGLFDGRTGEDDAGSTAHLAKLLGLPVVLVVDAAAMGRSAAAMVLGYRQFDPGVQLAGVILNNLGSEGHFAIVRNGIERQAHVRVLGGLYRDTALALPERHLGLIPAVERPPEEALSAAAAAVARGVDIDALLALAAELPTSVVAEPLPAPEQRVPIAVAVDRAFSFYYEDGLDALRDAGAEVLPFSPLADTSLPCGARGLYIGGGFPEVFAVELAANAAMQHALRSFAAAGHPIVAECGGHMYLGEELIDVAGRAHAMAGLTPVRSTMQGTRLTLGYRVARALRDGPLFAAGESFRAHEFHLSATSQAAHPDAAWEVIEPAIGLSGFARGNLVGSYLHLHFGAFPGAAGRFVGACSAQGGTP
ncbi:MAG: cobyrinate a,c-diamide synthase [Dehalococcoidia bacterium]